MTDDDVLRAVNELQRLRWFLGVVEPVTYTPEALTRAGFGGPCEPLCGRLTPSGALGRPGLPPALDQPVQGLRTETQ